MAAVLPLSAFAVHHYGWGGLKKIANSQFTLIANARTADDDVDPNFITGDNAVAGRYVIALVEANDDAPAPYVGPPAAAQNGPSNDAPADEQQGQLQVVPVVYADTPQKAADLCSTYGGTVTNALSQVGCFIAENMTEGQARAMSHDPRVISVSQDWAMQACTAQYVPNYYQWGLDQIDSPYNLRNNQYEYYSNGSGVNVYIMDSGISTNHSEFADSNWYSGTRASRDYNAVSSENDNDNVPNGGHGTGVASIVGGNVCGVAKNCRIHSVKVIEGSNKVYVSAVVKACDWVKNNRQSPAVVNMSFGGRNERNFFGSSTGAQDTAARRLANSGVTVVCSAGNKNINVDQYSPANVQELIVVGAADRNFARAKFGGGEESNYGGGVDLSGPGLEVLAAHEGGGFQNFGGTSAAAPFVSGAAARYLSMYPNANHYAVQNALIANASHKMQTNDLKGSPDRFVFTPLF